MGSEEGDWSESDSESADEDGVFVWGAGDAGDSVVGLVPAASGSDSESARLTAGNEDESSASDAEEVEGLE